MAEAIDVPDGTFGGKLSNGGREGLDIAFLSPGCRVRSDSYRVVGLR
ncbi:MAG: hypothetical protein LBQ90_03405 [Synergistaceae bacterium]|jgi:hypothetical protein|nr:hypothetical protein [Synergistaceae bacterium]